MEELVTRLLDSALSLLILGIAWRYAELRYAYERQRVKEYADQLRIERDRTIQRLEIMHTNIKQDMTVEKRRELIDSFMQQLDDTDRDRLLKQLSSGAD